MKSKTKITVGVIAAAVVIPIMIYTLSPLFINTSVNEPPPESALAFQKFMNMTEEARIQAASNMTQNEKEAIMKMAAQENNAANENTPSEIQSQEPPASQTVLSGKFIGVNDGIHNAEGLASVIPLGNDTSVLRLENFKATNGPDLYVYLATDNSASDIVNLGRLKGNIGNQNYIIPAGTDLSKYDRVLVWCRAFSVLFGSAQLVPLIEH
ncbi:MAG TPA: DM13 domain-containing protein [Nitrososphaeraceae archaeon]